MIQQLWKPTVFMTLSANRIKWPDLLTLLHILAEEKEDMQNFFASELSLI